MKLSNELRTRIADFHKKYAHLVDAACNAMDKADIRTGISDAQLSNEMETLAEWSSEFAAAPVLRKFFDAMSTRRIEAHTDQPFPEVMHTSRKDKVAINAGGSLYDFLKDSLASLQKAAKKQTGKKPDQALVDGYVALKEIVDSWPMWNKMEHSRLVEAVEAEIEAQKAARQKAVNTRKANKTGETHSHFETMVDESKKRLGLAGRH